MLSFRPLFATLICLASVPSPAELLAQEPKALTTEAMQKAARLEYMISSAESIDLRVAGQDNRKPIKATLQEPVQRWSHPIGPAIPDATVFVWTVDQRPVATAQIFYMEGFDNWSQEFTSLSSHSLTAQQLGKEFWATKAGQATTISFDAKVAPRENLRLIQMRSIARRFEAINKADRDSPNHLKLLPTPLYRFSSPSAGIVDGALFSMAHGIDPEVLLLIEAKNSAQGGRWEVTFAPMTIFACRVKYQGQEKWSVPYRLPPHERHSPFMYHDDQLPNQPLPGQ